MLSMQARSRADAWKNDDVEPPKGSPEGQKSTPELDFCNFFAENAQTWLGAPVGGVCPGRDLERGSRPFRVSLL